jgi:hypothetical protein
MNLTPKNFANLFFVLGAANFVVFFMEIIGAIAN